MKILEATVAILIVSSVLVVVYSHQVRQVDPAENIFVIQKEIMLGISSNAEFRRAILEYDTDSSDFDGKVRTYVSEKIPGGFGHRLRICNLTEPCKLNGVLTDDVIKAIRTKELYVEEIIVAADIKAELYSPKKVKLFVWEGEGLFCGDNHCDSTEECGDDNVAPSCNTDCGSCPSGP